MIRPKRAQRLHYSLPTVVDQFDYEGPRRTTAPTRARARLCTHIHTVIKCMHMMHIRMHMMRMMRIMHIHLVEEGMVEGYGLYGLYRGE